MSGFGNTVTSSEATVTVNDDTAGPQISWARTYTSPNTVTVRFNEPILTTAATLFTEDFAGASLDPAKWVVNNPAGFENTGAADSTAVQAGGNLTLTATATVRFWGGLNVAAVPTYTASASQNLRFGVDRVSHAGTGTATRSGIRITDTSGTNFVVFSQNVGEGGWQYNRQSNVPGDTGTPVGDNPTGTGVNIAAFDLMEDGGSHRMEVVLNGTTAKLYLDGIFGVEVPFPVSQNIIFQLVGYTRAAGDTLTAVYDNAKVDRITAAGTYAINNSVTVNSVELGSRSDTVILKTSALNPATAYTLTATDIADLNGNTSASLNSPIDQSKAVPTEFAAGASSFTGYQDDFNTASRDSRWVPRGPGGDVYNQAQSGGIGTLRVTTAAGDPNHLLFEDNSYDKNNQEILARIRVVNADVGDNVRGGVATSVESNSQGFNYHFRNEGALARHTEFLDDARSWGPEFDLNWVNNTWYWVRFKSLPNTDAGAPDLFAKVWKADGTEPEPEDWQSTWDRAGRTGFAGITATSNGGAMEFEVDYWLLKSPGLPTITATAESVGVPVVPIKLSTAYSGGVLTITWTGGGELFSAPSVDGAPGAWTGTGDTDGSYTVASPATAGATKFYQVKKP